MSVRNIDQGYYEIPSTIIPLDFVGAFSETVNADINISGGGAINIHIPAFTSVITATATLYAPIPPEYVYLTSVSIISVPILVKKDDTHPSTPSILTFNVELVKKQSMPMYRMLYSNLEIQPRVD